LKLTTTVNWKRLSNCNIIASRIECFFFKCYWYDTTNRGIRVDPHYGLVEINSKARHHNVNDVSVFAKQCQQVYYTYTPSFRKDQSRVDWLSVLKTKPKGLARLFRMRMKTQMW
jgi:hypothetical protein